MVPIAASHLTPIGFRRDIKFFLAELVGFLVVLILTLLVLLLNATGAATDEANKSWSVAADSAADSLSRMDPIANSSVVDSQLGYLRARYAIAGIIIERPGQKPIVSGQTRTLNHVQFLSRTLPAGTATFFFDTGKVHSWRRDFFLTAVICFLATMAATILLFFYLPRIMRPIEELMEQASSVSSRADGEDEASYLIQTFRSSISRLRNQEAELTRLHELEKGRADDLQTITATLTRSLASGFIALDRNGIVLDMNQSAREILHLENSVEGGRSVNEVFGETEFARHLIEGVSNRSVVSRVEVEYQSKELIVIGLTTVPLVDDRSRFLGMIALFADLTPIRRLENRVRDMQTLADLGEISAGIAHEFRNSLSTILGYIKLAGRQDLPEESRERLRKAEEEAALLSGAVEGLLSFARPMKLDYGHIRLDELVEGVAKRLHPGFPLVVFELNMAPATIKGDPALLSRAIENVIRNALEAVTQQNDTSPRIVIDTGLDPGPFIQVSDNGVGLKSEDVPRLMLPFQSQKPEGMGLGLPLARKIVLLHGGTLELDGQPGLGARVRIEFGETPAIL